MKIMILSPGRTSAVGSRAREWTVQIISWFLNHTRWMHLSTQVSNSYRVPLLRTALDIFLADLGFFCLTLDMGWAFWPRVAMYTPCFATSL
jgi:hypothetical protein